MTGITAIKLLGIILLGTGILTYFFSKRIFIIFSNVFGGWLESKDRPYKKIPENVFILIKKDINEKTFKFIGIVNICQGLFFILLFYILRLLNLQI